jgi:hypothetical protein
LKPNDVLERGGLLLRAHSIPPGEPPAAAVMAKDFPRRATLVAVGEYDGAISWDDPSDESGLRPHRIVWSEGTTDYELRAVRSADQMLALARELVCR